MKNFLILLFFSSISIQAQVGIKIGQKVNGDSENKSSTEKTDNSNTMGAIDTYRRSYDNQKAEAEKYIEMNKYKMAVGKIQAMANSLDKMKKVDPAGDYSQQENEINTLLQKAQSGNENMLAERQAVSDAHYDRVEYEDYMHAFVTSAEPSEQTIENVKKVDISKIDMNKFKGHVMSSADNIDFVVKTLKRDLEFGQSHAIDRYESIKQYWEISSGFYPDEPKITEAKNKINNLAKEIGFSSKENYLNNVQNQKDIALANKQMVPAVKTDKTIEALFVEAFNDESKGLNWDRTILKINLTSKDWVTINKSITGVIVGRKQFACIVFKDNTDGKCKMYRDYHIYQEYTGNGYSHTPHGRSEMASEDFSCSNIK